MSIRLGENRQFKQYLLAWINKLNILLIRSGTEFAKREYENIS